MREMSTQPDEPQAPERSRSVMDYANPSDLQNAMTCGQSAEEFAAREMAGSAAGFDWITNNLDMSHSSAQNLEEEMARLLTLKSYLILDAEKEQRFERITALAGRIFDVPIALVSLVDLGRQWFMSNRGLGGRETPRSLAFCAHAIMSTQDLLVVPNATLDPRFMNNALVTSDPHIRFYAGAPLICPEGYKLGTLCIIDRKPRPNGLNLMEKQNLRELAGMVMDAMVSRKEELERMSADQSRTIACAAHDLLTPLTSIELNLSLLLEDEKLSSVMDENQKDLINTAVGCSELMGRICFQAIEAFRDDVVQNDRKRKKRLGHEGTSAVERMINNEGDDGEVEGAVNIGRLIETLGQVIEPYPKSVPLTMEVDEDVPQIIISDDLKIFRSALNYLTNACRHTTEGYVHLRLYVENFEGFDHVVFECEDTGPGIEVEKYPSLFVPFCGEEDAQKRLKFIAANKDFGLDHTQMNNSGLGLYSVASSIQTLGGEFGFRPREDPESDQLVTGCVFWFSVPLVLPPSAREGDQMIVDAEPQQTQNIQQPLPGFIAGKAEEVALNSTEQMLSQTSIGANIEGEVVGMEEDDLKDNRITKKRNLSQSEDVSVADQLLLGTAVSLGRERNDETSRVKCALVIDDSLTTRKGIDTALTRLGFEVTQAENGLEGLQVMKSKLFDVVLCDFLMPVMDGLDLVQQYRAWELSNRPWFYQHIVGISAHATSNDAETALRLGMNKYFPKPIPLKLLKEICSSVEVLESTNQLDQKFKAAIITRESVVSGLMKMAQGSASGSSSEERAPNLTRVCLIAESSEAVVKGLIQCAETSGWRASVVTDGEDALRLLKMRVWDAVFINETIYPLTGSSCVTRFREWEAKNRVSRQDNIHVLSETLGPSDNVPIPQGFDGALGKPINMQLFFDVLEKIAKGGPSLT